jgi:hypothetical protein
MWKEPSCWMLLLQCKSWISFHVCKLCNFLTSYQSS